MLKQFLSDKKHLADIILVVALLIIGLSVLLITSGGSDDNDDKNNGTSQGSGDQGEGGEENEGSSEGKSHNMAVVLVDGKKIAEYSLAEDGVYHIEGYKGGTNTLVIENGKAYIREASCPQNAGDVSCVDQGKKSRVGEIITCLPNRVIVEIVGESEDPIL